jgi:hypothetical protein
MLFGESEMIRFKQAVVVLSCLVAPSTCCADVWGNYLGGNHRAQRQPFYTLLCNKSRASYLVDEARLMGVLAPEDLVAAMRVLWCDIEKDNNMRIRSIESRVHLPFVHSSYGHEHIVEDLNDLQRAIGSLHFGDLPSKLTIEVFDSGTAIELSFPANLDNWKLKLSGGKWQLRSLNYCGCDG